MPLKKGIVRRTFVFSSLLIALVAFLSFSALYFVMPEYYLWQKENSLKNNLNTLTQSLTSADGYMESSQLIYDFVESNNASLMAFDENDMLLPEMSSPLVSMRDGEGNSLYTVHRDYAANDGRSDGRVTVSIGHRLENGSGEAHTLTTFRLLGGEAVRLRGSAMQDDAKAISLRGDVNGEAISHVIATGTLQPIDEARGVILSLIPYVLAMAVAVGFLLSWIYARQISKPILEISDAAVQMRDMRPDAVCEVRSDDELGQLSANLNNLYSRLLDNIDSLKLEMERVNRLEQSKTGMMQSASHELKTPVAALAGMLDGMMDNVGAYRDRDKYLAECRGQVDKLSRLVWEILDASKADHPDQEPAMEETGVHLLVEQALEEYGPMLEEKKLRVSSELEPVAILTDPDILYRAVANIVSNAVRYTPEGGQIKVRLSGGRLSVENECELIPEDELEKLFEPFYTRSANRDRTKSGTGLGLYIVKRGLDRLRIPYSVASTDCGFIVSLEIKP